MIKKHKKKIILFLVGFLLYFILGIFLSYYLDTYKFWNVLFDLDTPRVFGDLSIKDYNHYRTSVHPLFVIFLQPIVSIFKFILKDPVIAILLIQSTLASLSLVLLDKILTKMNINGFYKIFPIILFAVSLGQIVFASAIETYIYAQFLLIALWIFTVYKLDKKFNLWDYIILTILGIGSIAITITNFFQFIIVIIFLIVLNKKIENRCFKAIIIIICVISISVFLAEIQTILWPSAPNFFTKGINNFIIGASEEQLYISNSISLKNFTNVFNANFSQSFNVVNLHFPNNAYLTFQNNAFTNVFSILFGLIFIILNLFFIFKTRFNILKYKLYYALAFSYAFNIVLHLFYGNDIAFIYICHYNFIFILLISYLINYFDLKLFKKKFVFGLSVITVLLLSVKNIILIFKNIILLYNTIEYFRILPFAIAGIVLIVLLILSIKKVTIKIFALIFSIISLYLGWYYINNDNKCVNFCGEFEKYTNSLNNYEKQLKDMKNEFNVRYYSNREEPINIYYFGMANRPKILYKNGQLIDIKTKEIIKSIEYNKSLIIPNEYTVLLRDYNNNTYVIFENEKGIYFSINGKIETIFENDVKLNLPEFENCKYSEILKVNHQEILFNIDGEIPKPNLITYSGAWYRDTMLATMVLEETNNVNLLKKWVKSINSIYDFQRSPDIKEADNLGELLYILGAVGVKNNDLVKRIMDEINRIKQPDGSISGNVDGMDMSYYPTALALFGADKLGIEIDLTLPLVDDGYGKLTWYYTPMPFTNTIDSKYYPYIGWAFFNYSEYTGKLYILDELYPLSYEGGYETGPKKVESECFISEYYCEQKVFLSHMWHASEMFLFLKDIEK